MAVPKTWTTNEVLTAADLNASLASTAWTAVTYTNSWVDFGGSLNVVQYRKCGDKVEIRGMMKSGTINLTAFTLPSGFRPPADIQFAQASNGAYGQLNITSTGAVVPQIGSNVSFGVNCAFSVTA
jgi:hypothetical protein